MLEVLYGVILGAAFLFGLVTGRGDDTMAGMLEGARRGLETGAGLAGGFCVFCGLMNLLDASGMVEKVGRLLRRPLGWLLGPGQEEALPYVTMNLAANMLGLGNAATPLGLQAARRLAAGERASNALCMFLVINASSVQLFPSTVIALRQLHGAARPEAVVLPALGASALSTLCGIWLCKRMEKKG